MYQHLASRLQNQKRPDLNARFDFPFVPEEAAVLVLLHRQKNDDCLVLTKRSEEVFHHKGQICFPGGVRDEKDENLWQTALREANEEIGLEPAHVQFVGELGHVFTPTGFQVTPFVGFCETPPCWQANPREIAEIFSVPIPHLIDPMNVDCIARTLDGKEYKDPVYTYGPHQIWGATGRIILDLLDVWKEASE